MRHRWRQLGKDERGTSMTEFAITLPIFMAMMSFVYYIGAAGHVITEEQGQAQRMVWEEVIPHTEPQQVPVDYSDPDQPHVHPASAADVDHEFMQEYVLRQRREGLKAEMREHEEDTYDAMASGGHWGESFRRTRPVDGQATMAYDADQMTTQPTDVVGGSGYARTLVDDTSSAQPLQTGVAGGPSALQPAASAGAGSGLAPVLGGGMRYGVAHGVREGDVELPRDWGFSVRLYYSSLVPPTPVRNESRVVGITRTQMENYEPYQKLLGIQEDSAETLPASDPPSAPSWPQE